MNDSTDPATVPEGGTLFSSWVGRSPAVPSNASEVVESILRLRNFTPIDKLDYGLYGLEAPSSSFYRAIKEKKKILVWGDYDVDGVASIVSVMIFLRAIGHTPASYKVPDRFTEGYGLNPESLETLIKNESPDLIITVDAGITASEEAEICRRAGVDLIVTDHHSIDPSRLPSCPILNPKFHPDPEYRELCGCAITYVLLRHMARTYREIGARLNGMKDLWVTLAALAGVATICDVVPLNPVNHQLVLVGMKCLSDSRHPALKLLLEASATGSRRSGQEGAVCEMDVAFGVGPIMNAVGRLYNAEMVVRAFLEDDPAPLVEAMGGVNLERREIQKTMNCKALELAGEEPDEALIFVADSSFHEGVMGLVASRLAETYRRPAVACSIGKDQCKASGRSVRGFSLFEALCGVEKIRPGIFTRFGGHDMACGMTFSTGLLEEVKKALIEWAEEKRRNSPGPWRGTLEYDMFLPAPLAVLGTAADIMELKPFGNGFETPVFKIRSRVLEWGNYVSRKVGEPGFGKPAHTFAVIDNGTSRGARIVFFNHVAANTPKEAEFIIRMEVERYAGKDRLSLRGIDYRSVCHSDFGVVI